MPNSFSIVHLWEDDLKSTICGLPREIVVPANDRHGAVIKQCDDCGHIFAGRAKYDPTPAEAALIEAVLGG